MVFTFLVLTSYCTVHSAHSIECNLHRMPFHLWNNNATNESFRHLNVNICWTCEMYCVREKLPKLKMYTHTHTTNRTVLFFNNNFDAVYFPMEMYSKPSTMKQKDKLKFTSKFKFWTVTTDSPMFCGESNAPCAPLCVCIVCIMCIHGMEFDWYVVDTMCCLHWTIDNI